MLDAFPSWMDMTFAIYESVFDNAATYEGSAEKYWIKSMGDMNLAIRNMPKYVEEGSDFLVLDSSLWFDIRHHPRMRKKIQMFLDMDAPFVPRNQTECHERKRWYNKWKHDPKNQALIGMEMEKESFTFDYEL